MRSSHLRCICRPRSSRPADGETSPIASEFDSAQRMSTQCVHDLDHAVLIVARKARVERQ